VWEDFVVSDSALAVLLGTFTLNPIRVFDAGAAVVAAIKSPAAAVIDDDVSIIGDAYIERTPTSIFDFDAYRLYYVYYPIDTIIAPDSVEWTPVTDWITYQVRDDTLAVWNTSGLATGRYFLKLDWRESSTGSVVYTFYGVNLREDASVEKNSLRPEGLTINAYPNPFNSSVVITAPAGTEIEIYDLRGRVVWERSPDLDNRHQEMSPTNRTFIWQPDQSIPSGIYLVKARTEDGQQITKRIVLIK